MMVVAEPKIRPLSKEEGEIYSSAVVNATLYIRSFRDAIALIRPFYDGSAETAYTDRYARVGLSPWFFTLNKYQQATVILHETMHVLNNHFVRFDSLGGNPKIHNLAGDFEINSGLDQHPKVDLSMGVLPDRPPFNYRKHQSLEQYYHLLNQDANDGKFAPNPEDCPVHGNKGENKPEDNNAGDTTPQGVKDGQAPAQEKNQPAPQNVKQGETPGEGRGKKSGGGIGECDEQGEPGGEQGKDTGGNGGQSGESGTSASPEGTGDAVSGASGATGDQPSPDGQGDPVESADGEGSGQSSSGEASGECTCAGPGSEKAVGDAIPGNACDQPTEERSAAADEAGIDRASDAEQTIAKRNTAARIVEEINQNKAQGNGHLNDFLEFAHRHLSPPKVSWQSIFRRVLSHSFDSITRGRADYSHRRVNRRSHDSEFIFPGMVQYIPTAMLGIDTSGSMDATDFRRGLSEAEGILKSVSKAKNSLRVFSIDTKIGDVRPVSSVSKIKLTGGGGTEMAPAWEYVTGLGKKNRPDVFVLVTDGGLVWDNVIAELKKSQKLYRSVILITSERAAQQVPAELKKLAIVIDIS